MEQNVTPWFIANVHVIQFSQTSPTEPVMSMTSSSLQSSICEGHSEVNFNFLLGKKNYFSSLFIWQVKGHPY